VKVLEYSVTEFWPVSASCNARHGLTRTVVRGFSCFRIPVLMVLAIGLMCGNGKAYDQSDSALAQDTHDYFSRLQKLGFAGSVRIARAGSPIVAEGFGLADREAGLRWSPSVVSCIGSITKQFTGAAILRLQEQKKLRVTDSLPQFFKNVPDDKRAITIHQLLTHTSGIVDLDSAGDYDPLLREEFMRRIFAQPLASRPGEREQYTNAGYSILGAIIEELTGTSYEHFLRDQFFQPLGMTHTGYILPDWKHDTLAKGYTPEGSWGNLLNQALAPDGPYWVLRANGGILSSSDDMLRWAYALLDGNVLSRKSMSQYWAPQVKEDGDDDMYYGYGWGVRPLPNGDTVITHNGGNGIFFAEMAIVPRRGLVFFYETNVSAEFGQAEDRLMLVVERTIMGTKYPDIPDVADVSDVGLKSLEGTYVIDSANSFSVTAKDRRLQILPNGRDAFAMILSRRKIDLQRSDGLSKKMEALVTALVRGDLEPMYNAFNQKVAMTKIETAWNKQRAEWELSFGNLTGVKVLGTSLMYGRDITVVRFEFAKGTADRAYVWDVESEGRLLGYSARGLDPLVQCLPVTDGNFATWDPKSGESHSMQFDRTPMQTCLHFVVAGQTVTACRK
jgi:CubicO group peptidase (beta-lactamase class C family)